MPDAFLCIVPGAVSGLQNGSLPANAVRQPPFNLQSQLPGHVYQHHMPAPNLAPGHALRQQQQQQQQLLQHQQLLQQQERLRLASSAQSVRPSFSQIGHLQPAQSLQASAGPNQPAQFPVRASLAPAASMTGAGYMHGLKNGGQAATGSPRAYPLKPGTSPALDLELHLVCTLAYSFDLVPTKQANHQIGLHVWSNCVVASDIGCQSGHNVGSHKIRLCLVNMLQRLF